MASSRSRPRTARCIYQHEVDTSRVLVAPWVAAQMTDLLQTAVSHRHRPRRADRPPGRRQDRHDHLEQGRLVHRFLERASPPACGWAATMRKVVGGLQGGTAPARAFAAFMMQGRVANRPVEKFETGR